MNTTGTGETKKLKKGMGLFDLVLFNIVAIVGLRWTAVAAGVGPSSIVMWVAAMVLFFIPSALVVIELSSRFPDEGGIYVWTREAFGEFEGYMCGFCYWVNNLIYYPNLLIFVSSVFLYVGGAKLLHLEKSSIYPVAFSLIVLWLAIGLNTVGLKAGKWVQNIGGLGTWIPATLLVIAGIIAYFRFGSANTFTGSMIPDFANMDIISTFATLCFGFAGLELLSCMGEEVQSPGKNIPRAIVISGVVIALIYILATSSLLIILPSKDINIISGVVQVIAKVGEKLNILWIAPVIALLMTFGGIGGCGAWLSGTARIPFVMGLDKYMPQWLTKVHPKWGTPANAILAQGVVSTLFILMTLGSNVKESYKMLINATMLLYYIPYVYMFLAFIAIKMKDLKREPESGSLENEGKLNSEIENTKGEITGNSRAENKRKSHFNFPVWLGFVGLITTVFAIFISLAPPPEALNVAEYEIKLIGGTMAFVVLGIVMFLWAQRGKTKNN